MTTAAETRAGQRPGLVGPLILIGLGLILLLNNLGLLGWGVWELLFRLWPLLLIAFGLELMIGRRSAAAALVIPIVVVSALGMAIVWSGAWSGAAALTTAEVRQPLGAASRADVTLAGGVGELRLAAMAEPDGLIAGTVRLRPGSVLAPSFEERGGVAYYTLREQGPPNTPVWPGRGASEIWELRLSPALPMRLTIDAGVGATRADLSRLQLTELLVEGGVGEIAITLPRRGELTATVRGGVGQTTVTIPAGVAARITVDRGLGEVQVPLGYTRSGDTYLAPGYGQAADRVDLRIDGGIGGVSIRAGG